MHTFNGKALKADISVDAILQYNGETLYVVCDSVGLLYSTIYECNLERFFA